jgi:hypothetical protein
MSYTLRPNPSGDTLSSSRDPIRTNFQILQDRFNENHVVLDGVAGGGKHKFLQMPNQGTPPNVAAGESGLYSNTSTVAPNPSSLFFRSEGNKDYQLTTALDGQSTTFGAVDGWTFLPGGLIMQYGRYTKPAASNGEINFNFTFPNAVFNVQIAVESNVGDPNRQATINTITTSKFKWKSGSSNVTTYHWMAIGN